MNIKTKWAMVALVITVGLVAASGIISNTANAARQSQNDCGLSGQSIVATQNGRAVGEGTSANAQGGADFGQAISGGASHCSR
jgi:hypothetical protein